MKLIPTGDKVVIRTPTQPENKAGIILHQSSQERPLQGTVIAIGPAVEDIKVGDLVAYTRFAPNEIEIDGETLFVMEEKQILTKIEE